MSLVSLGASGLVISRPTSPGSDGARQPVHQHVHAFLVIDGCLGTTLTPGSHTLTMLYESSTGATAQFGANYLKVQPL